LLRNLATQVRSWQSTIRLVRLQDHGARGGYPARCVRDHGADWRRRNGRGLRGRDTKLHRDGALKILPELFAADPECLARFTREAQLFASLNHPHIAATSWVRGRGRAHALVLEL